MTTFEDRLLDQLRLVVADNLAPAPARPRVRRRIAASGALAATAAVAAAAFVAGGGDPAFAVQERADGAVTVKIASISEADGLQRKLRAAGVPADVRYTDEAPKCDSSLPDPDKGPHTVLHEKSDGGAAPVPPGDPGPNGASVQVSVRKGGEASFTIDPDDIPSGSRVRISASGGELSTLSMAIGRAGALPAHPAPPC